jgi:hypothetical protein
MALIVEDGTGRADAESYISESDADTYFANRGNEAWADVENKEAVLRQATDYLEQAYYGRWKGYKTTATQRLSWPRRQVPLEDYYTWFSYIADSSVPLAVKHATAELAFTAVSGDLAPNVERAQASVQVGEISVTYDPASPQTTRYPKIDMLLQPFLKGSSVMVPLGRV